MEHITVETPINESIEKVWEYYTAPEHITKWVRRGWGPVARSEVLSTEAGSRKIATAIYA